MKYILMMHAPAGRYQIWDWSKQAFQDHIAYMQDINKRLAAAGEWVSGHGLSDPDQAKLVRAGANGEPLTDGVFPETKEFLAGYWIVDVETPERACAIAAEASAAPGRDGKPLNMGIEVRQIMTGPPKTD